jgi:hypothetical protein
VGVVDPGLNQAGVVGDVGGVARRLRSALSGRPNHRKRDAVGADRPDRDHARIEQIELELEHETTPLFSVVLIAAMATVAAAAPPYKYTTPVPPGIAAPKEMPTRFGTLKLKFFDGVPDQASARALVGSSRKSRPQRG